VEKAAYKSYKNITTIFFWGYHRAENRLSTVADLVQSYGL